MMSTVSDGTHYELLKETNRSQKWSEINAEDENKLCYLVALKYYIYKELQKIYVMFLSNRYKNHKKYLKNITTNISVSLTYI